MASEIYINRNKIYFAISDTLHPDILLLSKSIITDSIIANDTRDLLVLKRYPSHLAEKKKSIWYLKASYTIIEQISRRSIFLN